MTRLLGKVAVVTGATTGIGMETALLFGREGASVVVAGRKEQEGEAVARSIEAAGGKALFVQTDVTQEASVRSLVERTVETFGRLDVLYNNAGGSTPRDNSVVQVPIDEFWRAISLDLFGTFLCSRMAIPHMIAGGGGSIINAASIVAMIGVRQKAAYSASKGGVVALTRSMAVEFAEHGIRVNAVVPGIVATDRIKGFIENEPAIAAQVAGYPLGVAEPQDVARTVLYLASDDSRRVTGHMLPVDGGLLST